MADDKGVTGTFFQRVLVAAGTVLALLLVLYFLQQVAQIVLLCFAAILFAIFLDAGAMIIQQRAGIQQGWAVSVFAFIVLASFAGVGWLIGPQVADQVRELAERLPMIIADLEETIVQFDVGEEVVDRAPEPGQVAPGSDILGQITGVFSTALSGIVNIVLMLVIGFYLAFNPSLYIDNFVHLIPKAHRRRAYEVFGALTHGLRWWLVGQLGEMVVVGALTTVGFLIIDVPLAIPLGLIAGLLAFIPYLGPLLSLIPALLVAIAEGPTMVLSVLIVYAIVQSLESNVITPVIQIYAVSLPPALLIASQILLGYMAGFLGIVIATPLTVAAIILLQMLYVEDVLDDKVKLMGMSHAYEHRWAGKGTALADASSESKNNDETSSSPDESEKPRKE